MVKYSTNEEVKLGDHVSYRSSLLFWKWKPGRISYIPGISKKDPRMDDGSGVLDIGVSGDDGTFRGVFIDPETNILRAVVRFERRSNGSEYLTPDEISDKDW